LTIKSEKEENAMPLEIDENGRTEGKVDAIDERLLADVARYIAARYVGNCICASIRAMPPMAEHAGKRQRGAFSFKSCASLAEDDLGECLRTLAKTEEMLKKAGFALSHSNKFDIIIEYFISHGRYDIYEINKSLQKRA
jgi:hypothetical protein